MRHTLRVDGDAEDELLAAAEWYESRCQGLGIELVAAFDRAANEISEDPDRWPRWRIDHPFRAFTMDRFPYVVFFQVKNGEVTILAVAHARRRPGYWLDRSDG